MFSNVTEKDLLLMHIFWFEKWQYFVNRNLASVYSFIVIILFIDKVKLEHTNNSRFPNHAKITLSNQDITDAYLYAAKLLAPLLVRRKFPE